MFRDLEDMGNALRDLVVLEDGQVTGFPAGGPVPGAVDALARNAVFNPDATLRTKARQILRSAAACQGIRPRSLAGRPRPARGVRLAVRLGGHCYDPARLVLRSAKRAGVEELVFEQGWAGQSPWEFSALLCAAALREGWEHGLALRLGLPPLAGDLLPGGEDAETLADRLAVAAAADMRNVTLRLSPAALLRSRTQQQAWELLRDAVARGMGVSLRVVEPDPRPDTAEDTVLDALAALCRDTPPHLLVLGASSRLWPEQRLRRWLAAAQGAELAFSGVDPGQDGLEPPGHLLQAAELRLEMDWAARIVLHPEFPADSRRQLLEWLRTLERPGLAERDAVLLGRHEFAALGHLEFELWDFERMPGFRASTMQLLHSLYTRMGIAAL